MNNQISKDFSEETEESENYGNAVRLWLQEEQKKESMIVKNASMFRSYLVT